MSQTEHQVSVGFPPWIRQVWGSGPGYSATKEIVTRLDLHTVCAGARCPNIGECWQRLTATFMLLGSVCSRCCPFCVVSSGVPETVDADEPAHVARAVREMGLTHAVVTSVTRDDLPDGGAAHFARTVRSIRHEVPETAVEVLVPDFKGDPGAIETVVEARPHVFAHNIETVSRLYPAIRDWRADYDRSLGVLEQARALSADLLVKSALMLGHGETHDEVVATLRDLLEAGCDALWLGQYLQPTSRHRAVVAFLHPERFRAYEGLAYELGFAFAVAGPLVRSSYRADELTRAHRASSATHTRSSESGHRRASR